MNQMHGYPTTAFVLAAGLGSRLRPLTDTCPKPLLEVGGKPILFHVFERLAGAGVRKFVVNIHHLPEAFRSALPDHHWEGIPVEWIHEPSRLETGGGLRNALPFLPENEPVFLAAGDILSTTDPAPLARAHLEANRPLATLLLRPDGPPANVEVTSTGEICDLRDRCGRRGDLRLGYAATAVIEPRQHRPYFHPTAPESVIEVWLRALSDGTPLRAHIDTTGTWTDIGTPDSLRNARAAAKR